MLIVIIALYFQKRYGMMHYVRALSSRHILVILSCLKPWLIDFYFSLERYWIDWQHIGFVAQSLTHKWSLLDKTNFHLGLDRKLIGLYMIVSLFKAYSCLRLITSWSSSLFSLFDLSKLTLFYLDARFIMPFSILVHSTYWYSFGPTSLYDSQIYIKDHQQALHWESISIRSIGETF